MLLTCKIIFLDKYNIFYNDTMNAWNGIVLYINFFCLTFFNEWKFNLKLKL